MFHSLPIISPDLWDVAREARKLDEVMAQAMTSKLAISSVLEQLFSAEATALIERRIKESKLPERKLLADFDFDFQTGVDKQQIMELATLHDTIGGI